MKIKVLHSVVYEVLLSLSLYKRQTHLKYLTLSKEWLVQTKEKISEELHKDIMELDELQFEDLSVHFIEVCPHNDFNGYVSWLSDLTIGEIYEKLAPYLSEKRPLPSDLEARKQLHISLMTRWYAEYFCEIGGTVEAALKEGIEEINMEALNENPYREIERLTLGFNITELQADEIILVPAWHFRPLSLIDIFNQRVILTYPCPMAAEEEALLITKALAEEKRLQILSSMKTEAKSFTDLVSLMEMSKGNIHHHLLLLRTAGLLRILPTRQDYFLYQFRHNRIEDLSALMLLYNE